MHTKIGWDHKSAPYLEQLQGALAPFGVNVYADPSTEHSDWCGFILSSEPLSEELLYVVIEQLNSAEREE
jgi:hypothetical protein